MTVQAIATEAGFSYLKCDCTRTAIRLRVLSNGNQIYALQCLECGRQIRAVSKNAPEVLEMPNRMPFDETLKDQWDDRVRAHTETQLKSRKFLKEKENERWHEWYREYLKTTDWKLKRQAVMTRADNWCEGCRAKQAVQVHHLTYAHVGNEFLFELVAVCMDCHSRLHSEDNHDA